MNERPFHSGGVVREPTVFPGPDLAQVPRNLDDEIGRTGRAVFVEEIVDSNAAAAFVRSERIGGETFSATGSSKRHPGEERDFAVARLLAVGRALRKLGDALVAEGEARIAESCSTDHDEPTIFDRPIPKAAPSVVDTIRRLYPKVDPVLRKWADR